MADSRGASADPTGKPSGARHKTTIIAEKLMQADAAEVIRTVIQKAKDGDMVAARIVVDRICPIRKGAPVNIKLPNVTTAVGVADAMNALLSEMADGSLSPEE